MTKRVNIAHGDIEIKRLSMLEIREVVGELKRSAADGQEPHIIDVFFNHDIPVAALKVATGLDDAALDALPPTDVFLLLEAVKEVNAFFVETMASRFYSQATPSTPSSMGSAS